MESERMETLVQQQQQDNGEPLVDTTAACMEAALALVNESQMIVDDKQQQELDDDDDDDEQPDDNADRLQSLDGHMKPSPCSDSSKSTASAPETEALKAAIEPATSTPTSFDISSLANSSVSGPSSSTPMVGKLRHFKKEFMYNSLHKAFDDDNGLASSTSNSAQEASFLCPSGSSLSDYSSYLAPNDKKSAETIGESACTSASVYGSPSLASYVPGSDQIMPESTPTHVGRKPLNGPPCSLKILVDDGILEPLNGSLSYDLMGVHFSGDLLPNGYIRVTGTNQVFTNPSSWATFCRTTIPACSNKDNKHFGSAWSTIRFMGKRLDSYKLRWYRKQKKTFTNNNNNASGNLSGNLSNLSGNIPALSSYGVSSNVYNNDNYLQASNNMSNIPFFSGGNSLNGANMPSTSNGGAPNCHNQPSSQMKPFRPYSGKTWSNIVPSDQLYTVDKACYGDAGINNDEVRSNSKAVDFNTIDISNPAPNVRIKCIPFYDIGVVQPFLVSVSTNALLLIDFHMHLLHKKVFGYLAGTWNPRTQLVSVIQAFPCKANNDKEKRKFEMQVKRFLKTNNMILVGWYHSHPTTDPNPTVADIKQQIACERAMFENRNGFITYSPCVGLIASPRFARISPHQCKQQETHAQTMEVDTEQAKTIQPKQEDDEENEEANDKPATSGEHNDAEKVEDEHNKSKAKVQRKYDSLFQMFWVLPIMSPFPTLDIGRPFQLSYKIMKSEFLTQELLIDMKTLATFYYDDPSYVNFLEPLEDTQMSEWDKLKQTLRLWLPRDLVEFNVADTMQQQAIQHFWRFLHQILVEKRSTLSLS